MVAAKWSARGLIVALLVVLPRLAASWLYSADRVVWECHLDFEMLAISADHTAERTLGSYSQFFRGNDLGFSRIGGRKVQVAKGGDTHVYNFHRFVDFKYVQAGPYLKNTVTKITRKKGDTLMMTRPGLYERPGEDVYVQVLKLGPSTYSFGRLGMPLQICQGRQGG